MDLELLQILLFNNTKHLSCMSHALCVTLRFLAFETLV